MRNIKTKTGPMRNKRPAKLRPTKRGIQVKGSWKTIELDPSLFSEEGLGGLVCFEELTDYRLIDSVKSAAVTENETQRKIEKAQKKKEKEKEKKKAKKRKASEVAEDVGREQEAGEEGGSDKTETSENPPAKKKKKKRKKKNTVQEDPNKQDNDVPAVSEDKTEVSEVEVPNPENSPEKADEKGEGGKGGEVPNPENTSEKTDEKEEGGKEREVPNPENSSEKAEETEVAGKEGVSQAAVECPEKDSQPQPDSEKTTDKKKKKTRQKKKKKGKVEKQTEQEPQTEEQSQTGQGPQTTASPASQDKRAKKQPKKQKNWGNVGGSVDRKADVSAWKGLFVPGPVLQALSSLGFGSPTPIQALALPPAIRDHMDIVGAAETGSGKTLSFGIPMIHTILEWRKGATEDQTEQPPTPQVESIYLPPADHPEEPGTVEATSISTDLKSEASTGPEDQEQKEDQEEDDGEEDMAKQDKGDNDDDDDVHDDEEEILLDEEDDSGKIGCVKVIDNMEFDFDTAAEAESSLRASQKQPLLGLVLTPTRELAVQVKDHIDAVAKFTGIKTAIIVGGMSQQKQDRRLKRRPEIVIATPGRLWELIKERHPHLVNLRQLRCLVIDEADRMVEKGHFAELESLLEMLNTVQFNPKRQTFVFSATLTMAHSLPTRVLQKKAKKLDQRSKVEVLMRKVGIKNKPKVIDLTRKEATVETLTETRIHCEKEEKDFYLYYFLLQYPGRTMVFANSIDCIKRLNSLLVVMDRTPLPLHANMHQKQRLKNLERFAERDHCVLLTTDVAARGLDIPNVQHVIHYQVPRTSETYVHRSGRTARAARQGLSLLLIGPDDMMNFKKIYRTLGKEDDEVPMFPIQGKCMAAIKERVNLARKIEKVEFHNSKEKHHNSWFKKAADALEVELDEELLLGGWKDEEDERQQKNMVKGMKKHMQYLLSQSVFKNVMRTKYPTQMGKLSLPHMPLAGVESAFDSITIQRDQKEKQKQKKKQKK